MASVSGASGLGNTSLRGFGGMASGIDRDSLIEQMTLGTTTKITNQKNEITSLQWKQEAYRNVIDKIIDMEDNYFAYSSTTSLIDPSFFSKNQITALGDSSVTKYITATGSSKMLEYLSIQGVKQVASAAYMKSAEKGTSNISFGKVKDMTGLDAEGNSTTGLNVAGTCRTSNLAGTSLEFGIWTDVDGGKFVNSASFTFPTSYKVQTKDPDTGKVIKEESKTIDYTTADLSTADGRKKLEDQLNEALKQSDTKLEGTDFYLRDVVKFKIDDNGNFQLEAGEKSPTGELRVKGYSSAMSALGFNAKKDGTELDTKRGVSFADFNSHIDDPLEESSVKKQSLAQYMEGKTVSVTFGGQTKQIELITKEEAKDGVENVAELVANINKRLEDAFGKNNVVASSENDVLTFKLGSNASENTTLTVSSNSKEMRDLLGLENMSNKIDLNSSVLSNWEKLGLDPTMDEESRKKFLENGLLINGVKIDINADMTVNQMMNAINSSNAGVKATYLSATNQFTLLASETGKGREITTSYKAEIEQAEKDLEVLKAGGDATEIAAMQAKLDKLREDAKNAPSLTPEEEAAGTAAFKIFGGTSLGEFGAEAVDGKNTEIRVSYGNGVYTTVESTTNTIDLEGLKIKVSGEFGYDETTGKYDSSKAITFDAKADVDGVAERVKKFIDEYNALAGAVNSEMTTRPDKDYGPLTDEQKDEMSETSIENWEKKAKQGLLFGDSNLRGLSENLQNLYANLKANGVDLKALQEIGISMSDDVYSGGALIFDETKFKNAMKNDPDKVASVISGSGDGKTGMIGTVSNTLSNYATRFSYKHGGSNGILVDVAGTEKLSRSLTNNQIYKQLEQMQADLETLKKRLSTEQDSYISQFSSMETLISQMNSQSSYLASLSGSM